MTSTQTPPAETRAPTAVDGLAERLRTGFRSGVTRPLAWRRRQLRAMQAMLSDHEATWLEALNADLGKPSVEGWFADLRMVASEIDHTVANLARWAAPRPVPLRALLRPGDARIVPEPLGVALVLGAWNYPIQLTLVPMVYALAAGNAVAGKPSELAPATSAALVRLVPEYLDADAVAMVEGDADVATQLLDQQWDHIFYTGNGRVGRIVMHAAAAHLTPVTLELGGKSPAYVDATANLTVAAHRIAWGKFINAGQTCVAPDYVLAHQDIAEDLTAALVAAVEEFYGENPATSDDYARIVNLRHFDRLHALVADPHGATMATGGTGDRATRYLAPTILAGVTGDHPVMAEEIFGPILPVLGVADAGAAVEAINGRDRPLALYVFAEDTDVVDQVVANTSSGGVAVNDTVTQLAVADLPFGGVGASGFGSYHGQAGFETFSHAKAVLRRGTRIDPPLLYPPYTRTKQWLMRKAL